MTDHPAPKETLEGLASDLEELGVDVVDVILEPDPQRIRVVAEADSVEQRDATVQRVALAYQHAVYDFGDEDIAEVAIAIQHPQDDGTVTFTVDREWLPADRDDGEAWDEAVTKISDSMLLPSRW